MHKSGFKFGDKNANKNLKTPWSGARDPRGPTAVLTTRPRPSIVGRVRIRLSPASQRYACI